MSNGRHRPLLRVAVAAFAASFVAAIFVEGCGSDNAVVGGECASGYTNCSNTCVDLLSDTQNCGSCGNVCAPNIACTNGVCTGLLDGAPGDATVGDGAPDDALDDFRRGDGGHADGDTGDGTTGDGNTGEGGEAGVCMPPYNSPFYCGDCNTQCAPPNDVCSPVDGGFACTPFCTPPLVNCGRQCVDTQTDGFNCGSCGHFCPTFICVGGQCSTGTNGELVVIGHDYSTAIPPGGSQQLVLTNAVFTPRANPLRILVYERYALPTAVARVVGIIQSHAGPPVVQITQTMADGDIPANLKTTSFDELIVLDEQSAPAGTLATLGASWASTLTSFVQAGGAVVVLNGAAGTTQEMPQFITATTLLGVTAQSTLAQGTIIKNNAPGDAVGNGVSAQYGVTRNSASMTADPASPPSLDYVFIDPTSMNPVVIHKTY